MDWLGEFFSAIPDAIRGLWIFSRGWAGVGVVVGSGALMILLLGAAHRTRDDHGWVSAIFGGMAAMIAGFWAFGILPSAWVYFADGVREDFFEGAGRGLADTIIPTRIAFGDFELFGNFYQVIRDSVVMVETLVAMAAFTAAAIWIQKRFPRSLAEGEEARPQSGGYK